MLAPPNASTAAAPIRKRPTTGKVATIGAVLAAVAVGIAFSQFTANSTHRSTDTASDAITQTINTIVPNANADDVNSTLDQSQPKDDKEYEKYMINGHVQAF